MIWQLNRQYAKSRGRKGGGPGKDETSVDFPVLPGGISMIPEQVFQKIYAMLPAGKWIRIAEIAAMLKLPPHKAAERMKVLKNMGLAEHRDVFNGRSGQTGEWRKLRRKHK
jgi:hypothetical protein